MKRRSFLLSLALLTALPAHADTLADQVKAEASRLLSQVTAAETTARTQPKARPQPVTASLAADLQRFGLAASRLSNEIEERGGPTDLRCIFRGMAEETDKQLTAANASSTGADQAQALARLTHMLKDAVEIAPAVGALPAGRTAAKAGATKNAQCPAIRTY